MYHSVHILAALLISLMMGSTVTAKTIVVLMDGTWNEPEPDADGSYPQGDSTNIEKLSHLVSPDDQQIIYFRGVGTDGKQFFKVVDGAFGSSAQERVQDAYNKIVASYKSGDELAILGFSRGAATSRILSRKIDTEGINGEKPVIRFLGLFDTVAALGVPKPKLDEFRKRFHDAAGRMKIPAAVKHVVHLVSIDEDRSLFDTTLLSFDSDATTADEVWFAGNHGDVGGGWVKNSPDERQLAAITMRYMIEAALANGIKFSAWESKVKLPENGAGVVHDKSGATTLIGGEIVRKLASARADKPRLHQSVKDKYDNDPGYRPAQLQSGFGNYELVD